MIDLKEIEQFIENSRECADMSCTGCNTGINHRLEEIKKHINKLHCCGNCGEVDIVEFGYESDAVSDRGEELGIMTLKGHANCCAQTERVVRADNYCPHWTEATP